jgi:hypothetical protein
MVNVLVFASDFVQMTAACSKFSGAVAGDHAGGDLAV